MSRIYKLTVRKQKAVIGNVEKMKENKLLIKIDPDI